MYGKHLTQSWTASESLIKINFNTISYLISGIESDVKTY